jgi:hypothetical protein
VNTLRTAAYVLAGVAAVSLALLLVPQLVAPDMELTGGLRTSVTWAFWISFAALVIALFRYRNVTGAHEGEGEGPGFARFLCNNTAAGLFWLPIRLFLGVSWLSSGVGKFAACSVTIGTGAPNGPDILRESERRPDAVCERTPVGS